MGRFFRRGGWLLKKGGVFLRSLWSSFRSSTPSRRPSLCLPKCYDIPPVRLGLSGKNSGKIPETLSEFFLELPLRVRLGSPYNSRHLKAPEDFQNSPPPVRLGTLLFSEVVPERVSQSRSWNSQQCWGYF